MQSIDIIVPCYNEKGNIRHILREVTKVALPLDYHFQFIFVDDGSTDGTFEEIAQAVNAGYPAKALRFSRNFGKEGAIAAGLEASDADAAIIIDSDLQHPPYLIPAMISEWEAGASVVDAVKKRRQKENLFVKVMSLLFNGLMQTLTGMNFRGASDYKLLDRKAIAHLNAIHEKNRFFRGLTNWIGYRHSRILFEVEERKSGQTKWNYFKLLELSVDAITSYSSKPLHIVTLLGFFTLFFSVILGLQTLYNKLYGGAVSGFTTVILLLLLLSSVIMISMGIIGIYVSKIYSEVKNRPLFIVDETLEGDPE